MTKRAVLSLAVSAITTGFASAIMSFDYDVTPQRRHDEPEFYGYIPDTGTSRMLIFLCMILNGALLLLARGVSTAFLSMIGFK